MGRQSCPSFLFTFSCLMRLLRDDEHRYIPDQHIQQQMKHRQCVHCVLRNQIGHDQHTANAGKRPQRQRRPVSYTHLDVYKRQPEYQARPVGRASNRSDASARRLFRGRLFGNAMDKPIGFRRADVGCNETIATDQQIRNHALFPGRVRCQLIGVECCAFALIRRQVKPLFELYCIICLIGVVKSFGDLYFALTARLRICLLYTSH